eukprot:756627-Hanusia_phi.AAC.1
MIRGLPGWVNSSMHRARALSCRARKDDLVIGPIPGSTLKCRTSPSCKEQGEQRLRGGRGESSWKKRVSKSSTDSGLRVKVSSISCVMATLDQAEAASKRRGVLLSHRKCLESSRTRRGAGSRQRDSRCVWGSGAGRSASWSIKRCVFTISLTQIIVTILPMYQ